MTGSGGSAFESNYSRNEAADTSAEDAVTDDLVRGVLATLAGSDPATLQLVAAGLELSGAAHETAPVFGRMLRSFATDVEHGDGDGDVEPGTLTLILGRMALRRAAADRRFLARLEGAEQPFWLAVADAATGGNAAVNDTTMTGRLS